MILMSVIIVVGINCLLGYSLVRCFFEDAFKKIEPMSRWVLIYLLGQLLGSMTYWIWLLVGLHAYGTWILLDVLVIGSLLLAARRHHMSSVMPTLSASSLNPQQVVTWLLMGVLSLLMVWCLKWHVAKMPYGAWDAAAMWNFRVSYIALPYEQWTNIFKSTSPHPDYPLMHSISAARFCALTGAWQPAVTAWFGVGHAIAVLLLLVGTVMQRVGIWIAILGAMLLCASDIWWEYTTWQYADITLSTYMFACVVLICHWFFRIDSDRHALLYAAMLLLGTCAWTKNEGWPWVFGVGLLILLCVCFKSFPNQSRLLLQSAGCLALVLWMPLSVHLMSGQTNDMVKGVVSDGLFDRLMDAQRLEMIASFYWLYLNALYPWGIALLLLGVCLLSRYSRQASRSCVGWLVLLLFLGQLSVYLLTFLMTYHDLKWHLHTAGDRLFNQIWPLWILGTCLLAGCEKSASTQDNPNAALQTAELD